MRSAPWPVVVALLLVFFAGCAGPDNGSLEDGTDGDPTATPTPEAEDDPDDAGEPDNTTDPEPTGSGTPETSPTPEPEPEGETHTVEITTGGALADFDPMTITIKVGDKIVWDNLDGSSHTATADDDSFDTGTIGGGQTSDPVTFDTAGTFSYYCAFHRSTMNGAEVTVTA